MCFSYNISYCKTSNVFNASIMMLPFINAIHVLKAQLQLQKILKSGLHQMLSKLSSLSMASLRKLDEEANKFYDRKHEN